MKKSVKKNKKYTLNNILDFLTDLFIKGMKQIGKLLTGKNQNPLVKVIIRIGLCLLLLAVLEIPFFLISEFGAGIIYLLCPLFRNEISSIWVGVINYSYLITYIILLFKVIYDMSKNKDYKLDKKETKKGKGFYDIVDSILKALIIVVLIPLILLTLGLCGMFGMLLCLFTHRIIIIGPILVVSGLILVMGSILSYISDIVFFNEEGGSKK